MKLVLGVLDVAYAAATPFATKQGPQQATTTGKVAEILESQYHPMGTFFELRREKIAGFLADSMADAIQNLVSGGPRQSPTFGAEQKIEAEFRSFIYANEMGIMAGQIYSLAGTLSLQTSGTVLSAAAARGVNKRLLHPYAQANKARPAFVDTGLYVQSFRAVVEK